MYQKTAGVVSFASKAFSGSAVKKAKKYRKDIRKLHPTDKDANDFADKTVKAAKAQRTFVRGTAGAGVAGAYIANKDKKEESLIPKDY